ncbi:MAG: histidine kinase [Bacteroidales bacterium]|nr:histidine kinase [Bacteroidales bacterium]
MKYKLIIVAMVFLLQTVNARIFIYIEWYPVDSLLLVLPTQQGIERIQTLNRLALSLSFEDAEKSTYFADQAMSMAKRINYTEGIAVAYSYYGFIQFYEGNYPEALNFFYEALHIYEELGNLRKVAAMYMEIAATHFWANNIEKAIEIAENKVIPGYRAKDKAGNTVGGFQDTIRTFSTLGLPYRMTGRSDTALRIYQRYMDAGRVHGFDLTDLLVHEAVVAACYYETGNVDSAVYQYWKAFAYPEVNQSVLALKHEYMRRLASIYTVHGDPDSALYYYRQAYQWLEPHGFLYSALMAAWELGEFYAKRGKRLEAEKSWLEAAKLVEEMIGKSSFYRYDSLKYMVSHGTELFQPYTKKYVKETTYRFATRVYWDLHRYYLEKDDLRPAMHYLQAYTAAKDTLDRLTRNREAVEIQTRFETTRKDAEILVLNQANELKELRLMRFTWFIGGLSGLAILIVFIAVMLHRQNQLKNSRQTLLLQQRLFRTQMNPHFLFNSLASIQNFIIKEKPSLASDYLGRFSKLVRQILNSSAVEYVPLEEEISSIENYLALQKVRYRDMFDYTVEMDEEIDTETARIPPMLAQPFIENAIEHGILHKGSYGRIQIRIRRSGDRAIFEVEDDGVGREKAQEILHKHDKDHKSMATAITRERIAILNRKLKRKITLEIIDLKDEQGEAKGTRVVFGVPV